ncbi:hypothetical protein Vadar_009317 [Vaccinium darrowii]|uniref:Uncharacterized protein n=1 Tax=Vaccinium darrowii TaxID=229202 RepID=A0ACB7Y770_9ERIC|nr:hypothetical protein Vadar_009317 [Vaccinium darrowii]
MRSVEGVIRVANLHQKFYYLACSICNRSTSAYGDNEFQCNYCGVIVPALPKIKFEVQITDLTDSIPAMIFAQVAQEYYGITGADIDTTTMDGCLPMDILDKLSQPRDCSIHLRAQMNDYAGISECKFIVQSIFDTSPSQGLAGSKQPLLLEPLTPNKKARTPKDAAQEITTTSQVEDDLTMKEKQE